MSLALPYHASVPAPSLDSDRSPPTEPESEDNSPPQPKPGARLASRPFDKLCADVVLRTCDLVDFRVCSPILIEASPVFESMFSLPQPQTNVESPDTPIVDLVEDSKTLETLLRICYPIRNPPLNRPLAEIETVLRAAMKYEMELPVAFLTDHVMSLAEDTPLLVWALACRLRLEDVAKYAAKHMSKMAAVNFDYPGTLDGVYTGDYFRLREYLRANGAPEVQLPFLSPLTIAEAQPARYDPPRSFFVDHPTIICRSSDGTDFPAHKDVLGATSDVFLAEVKAAEKARDAADEAAGRNTQSDDRETSLPVIHIDARATTLEHLLSFCYPDRASRVPVNPFDIADVLLLARKYDMATVSGAVKQLWAPAAKRNPLPAYFAAATRGLREMVRDAAKATLGQSLDGVYICKMEDVPALTYHRLLTYHASCRAEAIGVLRRAFPPDSQPSRPREAYPGPPTPSSFNLGPGPRSVSNPQCGHEHGGFQSSRTAWLGEQISTICLRARQNPCDAAWDDVVALLGSAIGAKLWCQNCIGLPRDIRKIGETLHNIPISVSLVALEL